jgi:tetratricopeptide (TPR) repeat protein
VLDKAVRHVADVFPSNDYENREAWRASLPHALRLLEGGQECNAKERSEPCLLVRRCMHVDGRIREAVRWLEESCRWRERLDEDDPDLLLSQHTLAIAYEAGGQVQKAVELLEHVIAVQARSFRDDHPSRLVSLGALAALHAEVHDRLEEDSCTATWLE